MKIAFPTNNEKTICEKLGFCKKILIYDTNSKSKKIIENPVYKLALQKGYKECGDNGLETGKILPPLLKEEGVDVFVAKKLGEGMLDNLEVFKIKIYFSNKNIEEIINELSE